MDTQEEPCFSPQQPRLCLRLSPFFLTCAAYFLFWIPQDPPSWVGALIKCLPVVCLAGSLQAARWGTGYRTLLQGALLCSAVGDACLIWPDAFLSGVAAFAVAHLLYLWAFGLTPLRPDLLLPIALASVPFSGRLLLHLPAGMVPALAAYSLVLASMLWRGLARGGSVRWGALLFTLSDMVLAWDAFAQPLPHARLVVMTTYYAAQLLITLSAFRSPQLKTHRPGARTDRWRPPPSGKAPGLPDRPPTDGIEAQAPGLLPAGACVARAP